MRSRLTPQPVRLVFDARYRIPENEAIDPLRARKIIEHLDARGWIGAATVIRPRFVTMRELLRVHDRAYLESLDDPRAVSKVLGGVEVTAAQATAIVEAQRWATSGTLLAATMAWKSKGRTVIVNLGGGLHHARAHRGSGFCAFNDVAVAIADLRAHGFEDRVLVVDLDLHHGDGTRSFFADDPRVFTYSLHADAWDDSPAVAALDVALGPAVGDTTYLAALKKTLPEFFTKAAPALVFFVAGVDVAHDDRLGGWRLSADAVFERDRFVFELAGALPMVMVLAGGYGPEAWRYTARTLLWLFSQEDLPIATPEERALMRFRKIRRGIQRTNLSRLMRDEGDGDLRITAEDLYGDLLTKAPDPRLLGFYSPYGLELAFERYGLADHIRAKGYPAFDIALDSSPTSGQGIRVYSDRSHREVLIELVVTEFYGVLPYKLLSIEWLLLQDPNRESSERDPLRPGQRHPGLGGLPLVVGMLVMACERLGFDGLTLVPSHFYLAARARRIMRILDPTEEAFFVSLARAAGEADPVSASRRIERGEVIDLDTLVPVRYRPTRMVLPVSERLTSTLDGAEYAARVEVEARRSRLVAKPRTTG